MKHLFVNKKGIEDNFEAEHSGKRSNRNEIKKCLKIIAEMKKFGSWSQINCGKKIGKEETMKLIEEADVLKLSSTTLFKKFVLYAV